MWVRVPPRVCFKVWHLLCPFRHDAKLRTQLKTSCNMACWRNNSRGAAPVIEPGDSGTQSEDHATSASSQLEACCFLCVPVSVVVFHISGQNERRSVSTVGRMRWLHSSVLQPAPAKRRHLWDPNPRRGTPLVRQSDASIALPKCHFCGPNWSENVRCR